MRVEKLVYGCDPDAEFQEDGESFKIFTVWSEPVTASVDQVPANTEIYESPEKSTVDPKRLVTAVEFGISKGGFFFIETPKPNPEWLNRVFEALKEEGWIGYGFNEIRSSCRGEIEIKEGKNWTAVVDQKKDKVYHNRGKRKGSGEIENLKQFSD